MQNTFEENSSLPLVSIICPVYNAEIYLPKTIDSVLAQTYIHWELLLVVDIKSHDQSLMIAQKYAQNDSRIKIIHSPNNKGVALNRNEGLQCAKGDFISFLDSDDLWLPQKLTKQVEFMIDKKLDFTFHSYQQIDPSGNLLPVIRWAPNSVSYTDLLKSNSIGCLTVMIRSSLAKQFQFKPHLPHEDFIYWLQILKTTQSVENENSHSSIKAYGLSELLALYRVLPQSRSGNKKQAALDRWFLYRKELNLNLFYSFYYFTCYAVLAIFYRLKKT